MNKPQTGPFGALTPVTHTSAVMLISPSVKGSRKTSASCSSSLAHVQNLPANSNTPVQNAQGNTPLADAPCDQPAFKQLRVQTQCALPILINSQVLSHYLAHHFEPLIYVFIVLYSNIKNELRPLLSAMIYPHNA